jgi:hypothetical protein
VYIVKPPASAEGRGIRLVNRFNDFPRPGQPAVVQEYIANPHLIDGKKYDCRIYVAVTSFDPLRAYMYEEGLARFATSDYNADHTTKSIRNRYMHLTNYSVNKKNDKFVSNVDADKDDEGSKWSLTALWKYLAGQGVDVPALKVRIMDVLVKALIAAEHSIVSKINQAGASPHAVHSDAPSRRAVGVGVWVRRACPSLLTRRWCGVCAHRPPIML